jgi:Family of unknown function (DUF6152)
VRNKLATLLVALATAGAAVPALAHHSGAMFEPTKELTLTGVVKEFQFTNPHSWLLVDVKGADGKVTTWGFEAEGPSSMLRAGIHLKDFTPGTPVMITGRPMKDGRPAALWVKATRTSDNKIFIPARGFAVK